MAKSLADAFPEEQQRVRELLQVYRDLGPVGMFGAAALEQTLRRADKAASSGDATEMLRSYAELKGCQ